MTNAGDKDKWFTFLLAIVIALVSAVGGLHFYFNQQLWAKLDRVTFLIVRESDTLHRRVDKANDKIEKTCDTQTKLIERLVAIEANGNSYSTTNSNNHKVKK